VSSWTPASALRPICGEIFRNGHDRAQVLALWIALEGVISSILGAPVVGVLSEYFGYRLQPGASQGVASAQREESRDALQKALVGVSIVPWILCGLAWVPMYWTYPRDRDKAKQESDESPCAAEEPGATTLGQPRGSPRAPPVAGDPHRRTAVGASMDEP